MHACIHAYIHAYMHTCVHASMHTNIHTCIHTSKQTNKQTSIHTYPCIGVKQSTILMGCYCSIFLWFFLVYVCPAMFPQYFCLVFGGWRGRRTWSHTSQGKSLLEAGLAPWGWAIGWDREGAAENEQLLHVHMRPPLKNTQLATEQTICIVSKCWKSLYFVVGCPFILWSKVEYDGTNLF